MFVPSQRQRSQVGIIIIITITIITIIIIIIIIIINRGGDVSVVMGNALPELPHASISISIA